MLQVINFNIAYEEICLFVWLTMDIMENLFVVKMMHAEKYANDA